MTRAALMTAMIERCREMIRAHGAPPPALPEPLQPEQLITMCDQLIEHVEEWPDVKIHRWIGFVQGGMLANRMIDLEGARSMFTEARKAFGAQSRDVLDHLDPESTFEFDIGGEG